MLRVIVQTDTPGRAGRIAVLSAAYAIESGSFPACFSSDTSPQRSAGTGATRQLSHVRLCPNDAKIASGAARGQRALIVCTDIARYALSTLARSRCWCPKRRGYSRWSTVSPVRTHTTSTTSGAPCLRRRPWSTAIARCNVTSTRSLGHTARGRGSRPPAWPATP